MGYRGTEGSRTPADWRSRRSGRPRSYSARPATEPGDVGSGTPGASPNHGAGDDEVGYGTGEWDADHGGDAYGGDATQSHDVASRGPARGFPPVPGQPGPVYPHDDFEAWSDSTGAVGGQAGTPQGHEGQQGRWGAPTTGDEWDDSPDASGEWDSRDASGEWDSRDASGEWDGPAGGAPPDVPAAGVHWDAAPAGQWESTGDQSEHREGSEAWEEGGHWDQGDSPSQPWGEGSGHWDAPYGQWDENGEWHSPAEDDGGDGGGQEDNGREGHGREGNGHGASGYNRADFAIAGRDAGQDARRWDSANYPSYGGYPDEYPGEPEAGEKEDAGRRNRRRRGGQGRKAMAGLSADAGPGGPSAPGRGRGAARKAAGGSRTRTIGLAAAGVVVIAALAVVACTLLSGHSGHSSAATGSSPGLSKLPSPSASGSLGTSGPSRLGKWGYITSRATDAAPLTVAELYPAQFLITGSSFVRTTDRADANCDQALFGTQLQNAAKVYGCSQAVRASYISGSQTMMGTVGVVNLSSANDAAKAGNASGANDFVTPLNGKTGPTRNLTQGTGVVQAEYKGHYLILIWAEFTNLEAPTTADQRSQLEQFASGLISGSANIALSNRMVSGHPEVTGSPG